LKCYTPPDETEKWLRENDTNFGDGEYPYLSQRQIGERLRKETPVRPYTIDQVDFTKTGDGNYSSKGQLRLFQKDRHRKGQRDTEL
jgi:hypothetical protein